MVTFSLTAEMRGPAERVFDAIVDLRGYGRWLDSSADYAGTTEISTDPIAAGTTYVEHGGVGVRRGTVTELLPPFLVTFDQPMTMRPKLFGVISIQVTYSLTPSREGVRLDRLVTVELPWQLKLAAPLVVARFRRESERTVQALKAFVEASGPP
jgi:uncharacterized protein YndB with AHSA1/START domain